MKSLSCSRFVSLTLGIALLSVAGCTQGAGDQSRNVETTALSSPAPGAPMQQFYNYEFNGLPQKYIPTGAYTAEQILNNEHPGRKASPKVKMTYDAQGFDANRVFHIPPVGVHPRIYFGPKDLPGIRERLADATAGRGFMKYLRHAVAIGIDRPGTAEHAMYQFLLHGDIHDFAVLYNANTNRLTSYKLLMGSARGFKKIYGSAKIPAYVTLHGRRYPTRPAEHFFLRNAFREEMLYKAWLVLIDNDAPAGRRLGRVYANFMRYLQPLVLKVNAGPSGMDYWRTMRTMLGGLSSSIQIGCTYDWDYNFMSPAERDMARKVISEMTFGHYSLGMDLPPHWRNWNFIGMAQYFEVLALAIEGEKGYDPRIYKRGMASVKAFLTYGLDRYGFAKESVGYSSAAMQHLSSALLAMTDRGCKFITYSHYRKYFDSYLLWTMLPQGGRWISEGDLADFPPSLEPVMVAKYFYPHDPILDYVFQNLPEVQSRNFSHDYFFDAILPCVTGPIRTANGKMVNYHHGAVFHLPDALVDPHRGWLIARNSWSAKTLYMQFTARNDMMDASHNHADAGRVVLDALGIHWTHEGSRQIYGPEQNEVLIDGRGQGFFPTPATWLGAVTTPDAAFAAADTAYCYDWQWRKQILMWSPNDPRLNEQAYWGYKPQIEHFIADGHRAIAQYDPKAAWYYAGYLAGDPRMWDQDSWVVRLPWNHVDYSYATAGLVRGKHPYVLIADDIKKDSLPHLYTWQMMINPKVVVAASDSGPGYEDIILALNKGHGRFSNRRLEIRVLHAANEGVSGAPYLQEYEHNTSFGHPELLKRVVVPSRSVVPGYKIMIYPFVVGEPLPQTRWNSSGTRLTIRLPGQRDAWTFHSSPSGRTLLNMARDGKPVFSGIPH